MTGTLPGNLTMVTVAHWEDGRIAEEYLFLQSPVPRLPILEMDIPRVWLRQRGMLKFMDSLSDLKLEDKKRVAIHRGSLRRMIQKKGERKRDWQ